MRILVVTLNYEPDGGPSAPLYGMLCRGLVQRGHEVTVIAATPHYPSGRVPEAFRRGILQHTHEDDVDVIRVRVPSLDRSRLPGRLAQFAAYQLGATLAGLGRDYDVVLGGNPALEVGLPFSALAGLRRRPAVFSVHDVYPDVGVRLGIFRHRPVVAAVAAIERLCLAQAESVRILSASFAPGLRRLGVPEERLALVYDWVDTELIRPLPKDTPFAREHGLADRFVVLYAGNIGFSQGLEHALGAAERLAGHGDIRLVFVGDGAARAELEADARRRGLGNVSFLPFQPRPRLPEVLASADVALVPLRRGIGADSLPSKCYSLLAAGRPIVASVDEGCDTWSLVERAGAGACVPPEDPAAMAEAVLALRADPQRRERHGASGRAYALRHHAPEVAVARFEELLESAIAAAARRRPPPAHVRKEQAP